ncbi:DNA cytosine methyltransferase [Pseudomonas aeruginosa]|uniref:DNA cytosine methyltransferase n=1 Tax=Pseudomonas aeruginosa TaxID=287 RepID=UPI001D97ECC0|nr:DNA cytosine methyltransferase [Pseudomonas aeruginosa]MBN0172620.1 DNA cytosine methyltransferase [Pseudomonas aeruginosa]MDS9628972.1 DNA cytosine methyltransferase [Pseudomonas aeruginosa]
MTSLKKPAPLDFNTQYGLALDDSDDAIIVDLFAGGGGASTGLEIGLGRQVAIAINHNPAAISMHTANHPHAKHLQNDVWAVDPLAAVMKRIVGWLHASPDCTHHSQAAGGQPRKKEIRDLSWVVIKWAGMLRKRGQGPWLVSLENVKQIQAWGPLVAKRDAATGRVVRLDGTVAERGERVPRHEQFLIPDPKRKGSTWRRFLDALRGLGYQVDYWVEKNCDYGDPTTRERLYLVATADGYEPLKPEKTHAESPEKGLKPYRTAAECIDWSDLGQSIRNRKKPLAEATNRRIAKGMKKEVLGRGKPFIVPIANWSREAVLPSDKPLNTITAWPRGGSFALASASLVHFRGNCDSRPVEHPLHVVSAGGQHHGLATAFLAQANGGYNVTHSRPVDAPISAVTRTGSQQQLVTANLVTLRKGSTGSSVHAPMGTQTGAEHHALVTADLVDAGLSAEHLDGALWCADFLGRYLEGDDAGADESVAAKLARVTVWIDGTPFIIVDICLRMLKPRELYRAQGFPDCYIIEHGHDGRRFTKTEQVHMCGNSVSPGTMAAIARRNDPWKARQLSRIAA